MSRFLLVALLTLILTGCGAPRAVLWNGQNSTVASIAARKVAETDPVKPIAVVPIFIGTSRQRSNDLSMPYNSNRSQNLNFSRVDVGIPQAHVKGQVEDTGYKPNPAKHFSAVSFQPFQDARQFTAKLDAALSERKPEAQEILIFVHGYNNNFAESTFRAAQFTHDYGLHGVTVHYAWPSGGAFGLYAYDRDSANFARDGLAELLKTVTKTKAKKILLVGHSMGSFVVMEALRTLSLNEEQSTLRRINSILLAAPDIDLDVFEKQIKDINPLPKPMAVLVSRNDSALNISGRITGGHSRVGDGSSIATLQKYDITVLDATQVDGGAHGVFASSPTLMSLVNDGSLSLHALEGEGRTPGEAILADGSSVVVGAASMVIYLPARILSVAAGGLSR